ncbi:MAG: HemK family protein methyltransferase [Candidatus Pacebacteria bacterium]|nr:HemK family protein methyltransferase [Candidatus Paceibacterota bacterium]
MEKETEWLAKEKGISEKDLKRLKNKEPIDYIIGFYEFLGCKIDLSYKPLIPRAETEYWVEQILQNLKGDCLDIFSGSGCIGIAVLKHTKAKVDLADKYFISQIKLNLKINNLRAKVIQSDIFSKITKKYDFILANPPYIPCSRKLAKSISYEPKQALYAGKDGLFYIKKFLKQASCYLKSSGVIYLEFDSCQKKGITELLKKYKYEFFKDQYGKWRYLKAQKKD